MTQNNVPDAQDNHYAIVLPCAPEDFGAFISGLFGKPQTIERLVPGAFILTKADVSNLYHLVDQRIHQQNEATLVQFTVRIVYNDNSSVLLKSLQDFEVYNEIRPIGSTAAHLSWTYLVQFRNKNIPEKQQIDVSFVGSPIGRNIQSPMFKLDAGFMEHALLTGTYQFVQMFLTIQHTERTWGVDLESLLVGAMGQLAVQRKRSAALIHKHSGRLGFAVGAGLTSAAVLTVVFRAQAFLDSYLTETKALRDAAKVSQDALIARLDFLIDIVSTGVWPRFVFGAIGFLVIMIALGVTLGIWVADKAEIPPRSFVLFSKAAEDAKREWDQRIRRDWLLFGLSVVVSIATGIFSSWLFVRFFGT
jgi:hypothetical protein